MTPRCQLWRHGRRLSEVNGVNSDITVSSVTPRVSTVTPRASSDCVVSEMTPRRQQHCGTLAQLCHWHHFRNCFLSTNFLKVLVNFMDSLEQTPPGAIAVIWTEMSALVEKVVVALDLEVWSLKCWRAAIMFGLLLVLIWWPPTGATWPPCGSAFSLMARGLVWVRSLVLGLFFLVFSFPLAVVDWKDVRFLLTALPPRGSFKCLHGKNGLGLSFHLTQQIWIRLSWAKYASHEPHTCFSVILVFPYLNAPWVRVNWLTWIVLQIL
jgi:hypothetical protein